MPLLEAPRMTAHRSDVWWLRSAVFVAGAAVMMLELLGSRLLAPVFGTTLYVWTALITVTLAALALGYAAGGRLAERAPGLATIQRVLAVAAVGTLGADLLAPMAASTYPLGLAVGPLVAAAALLAPALVALGMVTPMAIAASDPTHVGRSAGNLGALATIGSLAGSLAVGLVLVPFVSVHTALAGTAVLLALGPLAYLARGARRAAGLVVLAAVAGWTAAAGARADRHVLLKGELLPVTAGAWSAYGNLVVAEHAGTRSLLLDGVVQGSLRDDRSESLYVYGLARLTTLRGVPRTMLIWGLGAGLLARTMAEAGVAVTVIEIDPAAERLARTHFGLPASVRVVIGDARIETGRLDERYDVVVLDAFAGDAPPWHLLTREAFAAAAARVAPGGVLALNFVGATDGPAARATGAIVATLAAAAGPVALFAPSRTFYERPPTYVATMLAFVGPLPAEPTPYALPGTMLGLRYADRLLASRVDAPPSTTVLTDAYAPLEAWLAPAIAAMRY